MNKGGYMKGKVAGALQINRLLSEFKNEESLGHEDSYVMGFAEGRRNGDYQQHLFKEALDGLISVAASRGEMHTLAYARYLKKRMGL